MPGAISFSDSFVIYFHAAEVKNILSITYKEHCFYIESSGSHSVVPGLAASAASVNLLGMHILGPHPKPAELETWGRSPAIYILTDLEGDSDVGLSLRSSGRVAESPD